MMVTAARTADSVDVHSSRAFVASHVANRTLLKTISKEADTGKASAEDYCEVANWAAAAKHHAACAAALILKPPEKPCD